MVLSSPNTQLIGKGWKPCGRELNVFCFKWRIWSEHVYAWTYCHCQKNTLLAHGRQSLGHITNKIPWPAVEPTEPRAIVQSALGGRHARTLGDWRDKKGSWPILQRSTWSRLLYYYEPKAKEGGSNRHIPPWPEALACVCIVYIVYVVYNTAHSA